MTKIKGVGIVKRIALILTLLGVISGCASIPNGSMQIADIESGLIITGDEILFVKAECLIEKNKIPIPNAVASIQQCHRSSYDGFASGFAEGLCKGGNARRQAEANRIRDNAIAERKEVYKACLLLKGYKEIWVADQQTANDEKN